MQLQNIQQKIFEIRGQRVMLDFDLAELYEVETKRLKEAVRRNIRRFPEDFMFELTPEEYASLRTQFATLKNGGRGQHSKYLPFAFTEHGVTMLASILNSDKAIDMSITIVRVFVALKEFVLQHKDISLQLEQLKQELSGRIDEHDVQLSAIYNAIENLLDKQAVQQNWKERNRIGFKTE
jgi:phage regulator Rha-like protein